jgi:predicted transcriptional regulator
VLLALLFSPAPLSTKEIAASVQATKAATCRALAGLAIQGLVVKVSRGLYGVKSDLAHFGRWNVQDIQHPQSQREMQ